MGDFLKNSGKKWIQKPFSGFFLRIVLPGIFLFACSAPATKMKCAELRFRLDHETQSEDQRQFMEQDLKDCEQEAKGDQKKDSATVNKLEQRLSPGSKEEDSL